MTLIVIGIIIIVVWAYVLFIRDWLYKRSTSYAWWKTNIEDKLWASSRTILIARAYWLAGMLVSLQSLLVASGVDITPFITELGKVIPEGYRSLAVGAFMILTGIIFEWLRRLTTRAVGE